MIQGTAADVIRMAMLVAHDIPHGRLALTIHDEILARVDKAQSLWYSQELEEAMLLGQPFQDVPLVVNVTIADNWKDAHA